jgi:hypothetical protein
MTTAAPDDTIAPWPPLPYEDWQQTYKHLHLLTQIAGKVRLALTPWVNHSWHVPFYVSPRGLTTGVIPYGTHCFELTFDLLRHRLVINVSDGAEKVLSLGPGSVAGFYEALLKALGDLGIEVKIFPFPNEIPDAVPFAEDRQTRPYDKEAVLRFLRILQQASQVFELFRTRFIGKNSPVHFFWGSFDLAVTRFSGRAAPTHPGGIPNLPDAVAREAYSHEVSSAGFWPGGPGLEYPVFYSYAYPAPDGFADAKVSPPEAFYSREFGEFILPYDAMRTAADPERVLLAFLQSAYEAAASLARWDRKALERPQGRLGKPPSG